MRGEIQVQTLIHILPKGLANNWGKGEQRTSALQQRSDLFLKLVRAFHLLEAQFSLLE